MKTEIEIMSRIQMYQMAMNIDAKPDAYYRDIEASINELKFILGKTESEVELRLQMREMDMEQVDKNYIGYPLIKAEISELNWALGRK